MVGNGKYINMNGDRIDFGSDDYKGSVGSPGAPKKNIVASPPVAKIEICDSELHITKDVYGSVAKAVDEGDHIITLKYHSSAYNLLNPVVLDNLSPDIYSTKNKNLAISIFKEYDDAANNPNTIDITHEDFSTLRSSSLGDIMELRAMQKPVKNGNGNGNGKNGNIDDRTIAHYSGAGEFGAPIELICGTGLLNRRANTNNLLNYLHALYDALTIKLPEDDLERVKTYAKYASSDFYTKLVDYESGEGRFRVTPRACRDSIKKHCSRIVRAQENAGSLNYKNVMNHIRVGEFLIGLAGDERYRDIMNLPGLDVKSMLTNAVDKIRIEAENKAISEKYKKAASDIIETGRKYANDAAEFRAGVETVLKTGFNVNDGRFGEAIDYIEEKLNNEEGNLGTADMQGVVELSELVVGLKMIRVKLFGKKKDDN